MKSNIVKKIITLFLIATILCSMCACRADIHPSPEDTIYKIEDAINDLDVENLLECIDSKWVCKLKSALSFPLTSEGMTAGHFIAVTKTILPRLSDSLLTSKDIPEVKFNVLDTDINKNTATVTLAGVFITDAHKIPFAANVEMKLKNDEWVICGIG